MALGNYRQTTVLSSQQITPNMQRIVLTGSDLSHFPSGYESGYIKLLFTKQGLALRPNDALEQLSKKNIALRTYTVRAFDAQTQALTIDFALHTSEHTNSPASDWAKTAKIGDEMIIGGPGATKQPDQDAAWYLFIGDMTALPAISCHLENLPEDAKGFAIIEVTSQADIQVLKKPSNIEIIWLINPTPGKNTQLFSCLKSVVWLPDIPFVWCACEFDTMRHLRKWLKSEKQLEKHNMYISSYWKYGHTEEQHKIEKQADALQMT